MDQDSSIQEFTDGRPYDDFRKLSTTFQVSNLAVTARIGYNQVIVMISHLNDGKPAPGVGARFYFTESVYVAGSSDKMASSYSIS